MRLVEPILWLALLGAGVLVGLAGSPYAVGVAFSLCSAVALTQSWALFSSTTGYVSLGQVVFYGLGAYATVLLFDSVPLALALLASGLAALGFALLVGPPVLRVRGPYFVILSFGVAELVRSLVVLNEDRLGQFSRMMFGAPDIAVLYAVMLGLAVAATILAMVVRASRFGAGLVAVREDETAAETIGIPATRLKLAAFALSAIIPGMVGGLSSLRTSYFDPGTFFDPTISFSIVTMVVVGGGDDARGPVIGSLAFVLLSEALWTRLPQVYSIVLGVTLIAFVLFLPRGLAGLLTPGRRAGV